MAFGVKLRRIRQGKNWSQQYVADKLNVSQSAYHLWESDQAKPSAENLFRLSELFEIDLYELLQDLPSINFPNAKFEGTSYVVASNSTVTTNSDDLLKSVLKIQEQIIILIEKQNQLLNSLKN